MERLFEFQMEKLKNRILKMGSLVDEQYESTIKAVEEENFELAKQIIERIDSFINNDPKLAQ